MAVTVKGAQTTAIKIPPLIVKGAQTTVINIFILGYAQIIRKK
jgi:hypothetical protein